MTVARKPGVAQEISGDCCVNRDVQVARVVMTDDVRVTRRGRRQGKSVRRKLQERRANGRHDTSDGEGQVTIRQRR